MRVVSGSSAEVASSRQQHLRLGRERAGDADALLLAAGKLGRIAVALVGEADEVEQRSTRAAISACGQPAISSGSATLSKTVRDDSRLKCWKIMPIERRSWRRPASSSAPTSTPSTRTLPPVGFSRPLTRRISVDLPAPERPMTPVIEPRPTESETLSSAVKAPLLPDAAKCLETPSKMTAASPGAGAL